MKIRQKLEKIDEKFSHKVQLNKFDYFIKKKEQEQNAAQDMIDKILHLALKFSDFEYAEHVADAVSAKEVFEMKRNLENKLKIATKNEMGYTDEQVDSANIVLFISENEPTSAMFDFLFENVLDFVRCVATEELAF